jgi:hypothetical protein
MRSLVNAFLILSTVLASPLALTQSLTADEIMKRVDERYTGDTTKSSAVLNIIDKKNQTRVRNLKLFGLEKDDYEKSLIFFMSPAEVEGTAYMTFDWENKEKEDDSWLYLPAMQMIKRVAASEESGKFMGSDFSYADINGLDIEDFHYEIVNDSELVDGQDCWVIQSTPIDRRIIKKTGYTSIKSWIRKDIYMTVKSIINVKQANRVKYFAAKDIENIQGVWTAKTLQMVTTRNEKRVNSSVLKISDVLYNDSVDEAMFDTQAMQRGI